MAGIGRVASPALNAPAPGVRRKRRVLLLVLDGLRPSSVTPALMPNLSRLAAQGVRYTRSRTGFPSETMVGAGELFTGSYPERSGITANFMPLPGGDAAGTELKSFAGIDAMRKAYGGRTTGGTSLFAALARSGRTSAVVGKEGPAELAYLAGATWAVSSGGSHESRRGAELARTRATSTLARIALDAAGEAPASGKESDAQRSTWLVDVAMAVNAAHTPDLLGVWLTDPDKSQHVHGLGSTSQRLALRSADAAVGELLADLRRRGELEDMDVVVTSDHGFSDHLNREEIPLAKVLKAAHLPISHVIASGNQHLVRFDHAPTRRDFARLRGAIARSPIAGLVQTVIENPRAGVAGDRRSDARLTGRDLRQGSRRSADAFVVYRRDQRGVAGPRAQGGRGPGHTSARPGENLAGHGSLGWRDINNTLLLAGPGVERARRGARALRANAPAGIFDVAPTILHLLGLAPPAAMQGRILLEALTGAGTDGAVGQVRSRRSTAWTDVQLGARLVRTGLDTEWVGDHPYFLGLRTSERTQVR